MASGLSPPPLCSPLWEGSGLLAHHACCTVSKEPFIFLQGHSHWGFPPGFPEKQTLGPGALSRVWPQEPQQHTHNHSHTEVCCGHWKNTQQLGAHTPSFPTQALGLPHLFRTISMGTPGLTMATFRDSLPRSTDITASMSEGEIHLSIGPSFPTFLRRL